MKVFWAIVAYVLVGIVIAAICCSGSPSPSQSETALIVLVTVPAWPVVIGLNLLHMCFDLLMDCITWLAGFIRSWRLSG